MPVPDQRKYPRVKPPRTFVVAWRSGMTRDVSYMDSLALGGLFIRTRRPVPLRSSVQLLLDTPAGQIRGRAIVRRVHEKTGMALQIIAMDPGDRALVDRARPILATPPIPRHSERSLRSEESLCSALLCALCVLISVTSVLILVFGSSLAP